MLRHRIRLTLHLMENTVGDIIVAAPVGGAFGIGELIHIVTVQFVRQLLRGGVNLAGAFDKVGATAIKRNLFDFAFCRAGRHYRDKRQAEQSGEPGFGNRR